SLFLLGVGGAVKLWPLALVPWWIGRAYQRGRSQAGLPAVAVGAGGDGAPVLIFLAPGGARGGRVLPLPPPGRRHAGAVWSSLALALNGLGLLRVANVFEFGAWDIHCGPCELFATVSTVAVIGLALVPQLAALRKSPKGASAPGMPLPVATAAVLGFIVGS